MTKILNLSSFLYQHKDWELFQNLRIKCWNLTELEDRKWLQHLTKDFCTQFQSLPIAQKTNCKKLQTHLTQRCRWACAVKTTSHHSKKIPAIAAITLNDLRQRITEICLAVAVLSSSAPKNCVKKSLNDFIKRSERLAAHKKPSKIIRWPLQTRSKQERHGFRPHLNCNNYETSKNEMRIA